MDTQKLKSIAWEYRVPLILAGFGILLLTIAFFLLVRTQTSASPVEFVQKSASESAVLTKVRVDVEGAVISPGVYNLPEGSRVWDGIILAGGLAASADREWIEKNMNKAAKLIDGGKVYIPEKGENNNTSNISNINKTSEKLLGVTTGLVNINSATQSELEALPGVGPVTAQKIIDSRPYANLEELKTKKAVGNALFEKIKGDLTI
jgi:competence protein ComEA